VSYRVTGSQNVLLQFMNNYIPVFVE